LMAERRGVFNFGCGPRSSRLGSQGRSPRPPRSAAPCDPGNPCARIGGGEGRVVRTGCGRKAGRAERESGRGQGSGWLDRPGACPGNSGNSARLARQADHQGRSAAARSGIFPVAVARVWLLKPTTKVAPRSGVTTYVAPGSQRRKRRGCVTSVATCATCALSVSYCRSAVFRGFGDPTAGFDRKTDRFGPEKHRFRAQSGARMRHMCSIVGFSSIPTVLDFSANFRNSSRTVAKLCAVPDQLR
jgi:hypothetical protein